MLHVFLLCGIWSEGLSSICMSRWPLWFIELREHHPSRSRLKPANSSH
jgi:hypothetical protein